jgi:catechol 2,3-dioxygenase-like lactoylglutathione lyase family enzyme
MRLYRVILPVTNIEEASSFYSSILGQPGKRVSGGRHYFGDAKHGCVLAVYSPADDGDGRRYGLEWQPHPQQYVYFSVEGLEAVRQRCIVAGAREVTEIESMPWGETMFYALDPFGNPISFVKAGTEFVG